MKKTRSFSLAMLIAALALCSCSDEKNNNSVSSTDINSTVSTVVSSENADENARELLFSWEFRLDGVDYILPFDYSMLPPQGYALDWTDNRTLKARAYSIGATNPTKNGNPLRVVYWNPYEKSKRYSECKIGQIEINLKVKHELILPGNFVFDENTTPQSILDQYGEPDRLSEQEDYTEITYRQDTYSVVNFLIYTNDSGMKPQSYVMLQNFAG